MAKKMPAAGRPARASGKKPAPTRKGMTTGKVRTVPSWTCRGTLSVR